MPRGKTVTAEQIIGKLCEAEVGLAQGKTVPEVVRKPGVTEQTYYRSKREYGGLRTDQAKRLKRLLADAELDKAILREVASGYRRRAQLNFRARRSGARRSSTCVTRSAATWRPNAGHAGYWGRPGTRSDGRSPLPMTSRSS